MTSFPQDRLEGSPPVIKGTSETALTDARWIAASVLSQVVGKGQSLATTLPPVLNHVAERDRGLLRELCYGTLRWYQQLEYLLERLLKKSLKRREQEVWALLCLGLYQILYMRVPDYAAVSTTVATAQRLGKPWAAGLINAVLRNFQRRRPELLAELAQDDTLQSSHPRWLVHCLKREWPLDWQAILAANNAHPPQSLRVNLNRTTRHAYLRRLSDDGIEAIAAPYAAAGIILGNAYDARDLPGFHDGLVSVQDSAAQLAAELLDLRPGLRVLDGCAAPGGKTCHILEAEPDLETVLALDIDAGRLAQVQENLDRLGLRARLIKGDALDPDTWWDGVPYDRILLDTPCSSIGVIRRHPDIKILRAATDISYLAQRQRALLSRLWPLLAPGGMLVYATCSILRQENTDIVADFLVAQPDAEEKIITAEWGRTELHGRQILPGEADMDGFYYACLVKNRNH